MCKELNAKGSKHKSSFKLTSDNGIQVKIATRLILSEIPIFQTSKGMTIGFQNWVVLGVRAKTRVLDQGEINDFWFNLSVSFKKLRVRKRHYSNL